MDSKSPSLATVRSRRVLHSWKEIANYLQVAPRTAQRRHQVEGLPVHHLGTGPKARVAAYSDELDAWAAGEGRRAAAGSAPAVAPEARVLRRTVVSAILLAASLLPACVLIYRSYFSAGAPARATVEGTTLTVYDDQNRLCWKRDLPGVNPEAYFPQSNFAFRTARRAKYDTVLIEDIDGDGRTETLLNFWPKPLAESPGKLICFEQNGKIRWEFRFGRQRSLGGRQLGSNYRGVLTQAIHAHGKRWVLSVSHHDPGLPAYAAVLDPSTGILHQEYWHPGWIIVSRVSDLDGDGSDEVLLAGYNNPGSGLGHAGLVALRIAAAAQPRAPDRVDSGLAGFSGGGEIAYVLFPRSDLVTAEGMPAYVDMLEVQDGTRIVVRTVGPQYANLVYYLDLKLRLTQFSLEDGFASVHEQWRRRGLLDHRLTQSEIAELGKVQAFTTTPDGNDPDIGRFWRLP